MSQTQTSQIQTQKIIKINLEELYEIGLPSDSAVVLLDKILKFYNIGARVKAIYGVNPDIDKTIVLKSDGTIDYADIDVEKELQNCEIVVELFDGYEKAFACLQ